MKKAIFFLSLFIFLLQGPISKADEANTLTLTGSIVCNPNTHTTDHDHELLFKEEGSDREFDIVDSPALVSYHHQNDKNLKAQINGYITSKFLFWGGNLVVTSYEILEEGESQPVAQAVIRSVNHFDRGGSRR